MEDYAKNINMSVFLFLLQGKTLPILTGRKVEPIPTTAQKLGWEIRIHIDFGRLDLVLGGDADPDPLQDGRKDQQKIEVS